MEEHEKTEYINKYLFDILTAINEIPIILPKEDLELFGL